MGSSSSKLRKIRKAIGQNNSNECPRHPNPARTNRYPELGVTATDQNLEEWLATETAAMLSQLNIRSADDTSEDESYIENEKMRKKFQPTCKYHQRINGDSYSSFSSASARTEPSPLKTFGMHSSTAYPKSMQQIKSSDSILGFGSGHDGLCTYTAYIQCDDSDRWTKLLARTSRTLTGLQRQFQSTVKFGDNITYYRCKSVRLFQIIGPNKGQVIRCKAALPKTLSELLITPIDDEENFQAYAREISFARLCQSRPNLTNHAAKKATKSMTSIMMKH